MYRRRTIGAHFKGARKLRDKRTSILPRGEYGRPVQVLKNKLDSGIRGYSKATWKEVPIGLEKQK